MAKGFEGFIVTLKHSTLFFRKEPLLLGVFAFDSKRLWLFNSIKTYKLRPVLCGAKISVRAVEADYPVGAVAIAAAKLLRKVFLFFALTNLLVSVSHPLDEVLVVLMQKVDSKNDRYVRSSHCWNNFEEHGVDAFAG